MADYFRIVLQNSGEFLKNGGPEKFIAAAKKLLVQEMITAADIVMAGLIKATPVGVTKALRGAWSWKKIDVGNGETQIVIGNSKDYLLPVDQGRIAKMPPVEPIILWAKRKLGLTDKEAKRAGWGIAIWKMHHPTKGQDFAIPAAEKGLDKAGKILQGVVGMQLQAIFGKPGESTESK